MFKKITAAALLLAALAGYAQPGAPVRADDAMYWGGAQTPDGIRIPGAIQLLTNTPYYKDLNTPDDQPEGAFAPQTVNVLRTEGSWSVGPVQWEIETMFGPRWVRPKPWQIDIAPPERIRLMSDTPLYTKASEKGGPVTVLSPQEVEVAGAEKQWFYANDPTKPAWIKVRTTYMGDLWAHIPVNQIGAVQPVERSREHFYNLYSNMTPGAVLGVESWPEGAELLSGIYEVKAELTTIYDRLYEVDLGNGTTTWTSRRGTPIVDTNETLELKSETVLIEEIWSQFHEKAVLNNEKVTAFEKVEGPIYEGVYRGIIPAYLSGPWYHVHTSKGDGWINKYYGMPEDAVPVNWKVYLSNERELKRYPDVSFDQTTLLVRNQTVEATLAWHQPNGSLWIYTTLDGRAGWLPVWNPGEDQIWDQAAPTLAQLRMEAGNQYVWVGLEDGRLMLYDDQTVGFVTDGVERWDAAGAIAEYLGFKAEVSSDSVTVTSGDYAFKLSEGLDEAQLRYKGMDHGVRKLERPVTRQGEGWFVSQSDMKALYGMSMRQFKEDGHYSLSAGQFSAVPGEMSFRSAAGSTEFQVTYYDYSLTTLQDPDRVPLTLTLSEGGKVVSGESQEARLLGEQDAAYASNQVVVKAQTKLSPGAHRLTAVVRSGDRLVWEQEITVEVK